MPKCVVNCVVSCLRYCWSINVDSHPLGYICKSDAEFDESFKSMQSSADWVDPRKGPLFNIIDALSAKNNEEKD